MYEKYLKLLKDRGVTTYQVCKETGIPESTISMWKARKDDGGKLGLTHVATLAKYFGVPIEYFLEEVEA